MRLFEVELAKREKSVRFSFVDGLCLRNILDVVGKESRTDTIVDATCEQKHFIAF